MPVAAPAPVPVSAPESIAAIAETVAASPAPAPVSIPAETVVATAPAVVPSQPGVTARPEDILKNMGGDSGLSQVETQGAAPAPAEDVTGTPSAHHPRRRRAQVAEPAQMELMQVETSAAAAAAAPAEDTTPRSHGPGRRRRNTGQAIAAEPLVQVETQQ
jgi:hypothetical protein